MGVQAALALIYGGFRSVDLSLTQLLKDSSRLWILEQQQKLLLMRKMTMTKRMKLSVVAAVAVRVPDVPWTLGGAISSVGFETKP